ncbi:4Fe-4S binding protein [Selenomonas sp. oral taxon 149]|nr:4Fe-4S binding protein [Selenomonas sp. oral taxon 149]
MDVIAAAHCLHCDLCHESCPVEAIERLGNTACSVL